MEQEQADTMCIPSTRKCERWQIFHSGPQRRASGLYRCLLRAGPAGPSPPLAGPAMPCTVRLMALWSQAANLSLSRNKPLRWQMSGIVPMLPFGVCGTWWHQLARVFWGNGLRFGPISAVKQGTRAVLCETENLGSASSLQWVCTHTEWEYVNWRAGSFNIFPCSP